MVKETLRPPSANGPTLSSLIRPRVPRISPLNPVPIVVFRAPRGGVTFGDVDLIWYPNQGESPLASSLGQFQDHLALSVTDLDAWIAKLKSEDVTFLSDVYPLGDTRAVMLEGPSREGLELVALR